jgi:hypothetical protein
MIAQVVPIILRVALLVVTLFPLAAVTASDPRDPYDHFFQPTFGDFQEELDEARADGLPRTLYRSGAGTVRHGGKRGPG